MDSLDNARCIGTKNIVIQSEGGGSETSGMLALYVNLAQENEESTLLGDNSNSIQETHRHIDASTTHTIDNENANVTPNRRSLIVMLTEGNETFCSILDLSNLKMTREQRNGKDPIAWMTQTLLEGQEHPQQLDGANESNAHPVFSQISNSATLKIKFTNNGIVRVVYAQDIPQTAPSPLPFLHQTSISFMKAISSSHSVKIHSLKIENERNAWKDAATKLSIEHWKDEKEQLMNRFLILLNRVKGDLRTANGKVSEETQKYQVLQEKYRRLELELNKGRELVVDHIDEHDANIYDDVEVMKLAAGDRVDGSTSNPTSRRPGAHMKGSIMAKKRKLNASAGDSPGASAIPSATTKRTKATVAHGGADLLDGTQDSSSKMRKNPLTGSIEIWDADAMFSDSSGDEQEHDGGKKQSSLRQQK
jgi:hypothetical protein